MLLFLAKLAEAITSIKAKSGAVKRYSGEAVLRGRGLFNISTRRFSVDFSIN